MTVLAAIRPDDWNLPLFIHVLGAFTLIGALVTAASFLFAARRDGSLEFTRLGYRSLLIVALPAFVVNRAAAQWIASKEGLDEEPTPTWIEIGFISTDPGLLLLIAATVAAGLAVRRARRSETTAAGAEGGGGSRAASVAAWLVSLLVVLYLVVVWVMATKPA